jgi:hypothetical protein
VPISERALIQRLNRKLRDADLTVKTTKGRAELDLGRHYVLNRQINSIEHKNINLEEYGRKHGVLRDYEHLAE